MRGIQYPFIVSLFALTTGCVAIGSTTQAGTPTLGRALIDLQSAFEKGAINEAEYDAARHDLLQQTAD